MSEQKVVEQEAPKAATQAADVVRDREASEPYIAILIPRQLVAEWVSNLLTVVVGALVVGLVYALMAEE